MDDEISNFVSITSCNPQKAAQYLRLTDNNLEQAIQLFFDSPNLDLGEGGASNQPASTGSSTTRHPATSSAQDPITIDSDEDMSDWDNTPARQNTEEDDEAMARRLQEEMYGGAGAEGGVRAPLGRTTETLVGPGSSYLPATEAELDAMVQEQMAARRRPGGGARQGIFNQRSTQNSVWENDDVDPSTRRRELSAATGGASDTTQKANLLAEMYRPPFELLSHMKWDEARDQGKEKEKWILVNVQDSAIFDCQVLNRDIWKNTEIKATVREHFIFMQYAKDDPQGQQYINYYFHARDSADAYPHIAIVDPRTGEQVKVWSGPPVPKPMEFLMQLHEFLDRYSLKANAKNPVATRKQEKNKVDVDRMTEEEMLEMAMKNSLENNKGPKDEDPDELTKDTGSKGKGKAKVAADEMDIEEPATSSAFALISSSSPHTEPPNGPGTTRIQFRSPDGKRQVRRFNVSDPVRTLYEWLKESPWEGKECAEFELVFVGRNLIDSLNMTIEEAGLKNGSINLVFED
ncbi:UBX-domain-containing protein [Delitschia confertaspora ATCC 74209]|uniref:UBX-domain-containing protein n=1 Tax=Delitschia confertaspora ATCC 74209 TaxID=1513339 RepID=A0A9P4JUW6_9PLEO|nr:UBX-domain-containing protein [Delitschia confertaspora ATCC 74209]